ncbi:RagB/SusD family nutrient uptake outer membrane protein [Massilibacteroides sp.]|uniref:RagB/SusD family nutrient uptake outer membrane protein n=1 Tax=Massilibacteroides sp. TaxID=2034766 RepID=UPI0026058F1C|nr:RagB/SusD family nutrient uptake outer membrane protein [Massilibacteroides sp.]MDD4516292.1 RagB/SusD family nutrient uptake outer membrane protein [Massilibacteroides sp.]
MKNLRNYIALVAVGAICCSCEDFLDRTPDDKVNEQEVFTRYEKVNELVTDLYAEAKGSNKPLLFFNHFSASAITDECSASSHEASIPHQFHIGNYGPSQGMPDRSSVGQYWWDLYTRIRKANIILDGVKKYNTPDNPQVGREGDITKRVGETYFLRGYLHFLLLRAYGEAPYLDYLVNPEDEMTFEKISAHSLVEKICQDADSAYQRVEASYGGQDFGRVDKGACLGLKAMARWIAATPMWNGGNFPDDTRIFKEEYTYSADRWEAAKKASKAVIDCVAEDGSPRYKLYTKSEVTDFGDLDGKNTSNSKVQKRLWNMFFDMESIQQEWVWFVTRDKDTGWSGDILPPSQGGHARQRPLQEQVDEYEYIASDGYGYPIYGDRAKADGYDDGNPYESVKRDPRFYRDIRYHGSIYDNKALNTAEGNDAVSGSYQENASHTGYYMRKFYKDAWNKGDGGHTINAPAIWRLPEIMYIYCEAVNETSGPNQEIYDMLNEIRARSFMAPIPPVALTDKAIMNDYIQRERRVELFYENHRIWHTRLYLEADDQTELAKEKVYKDANSWPYAKTQRWSHGMKPVEDPNGKIEVDGKKYRMERIVVNDGRVFETPKHYLFPIMSDELKRTPGLVQNPGW